MRRECVMYDAASERMADTARGELIIDFPRRPGPRNSLKLRRSRVGGPVSLSLSLSVSLCFFSWRFKMAPGRSRLAPLIPSRRVPIKGRCTQLGL